MNVVASCYIKKKKKQGLLLKCYQYPYVVTVHTPASQMGAMNS